MAGPGCGVVQECGDEVLPLPAHLSIAKALGYNAVLVYYIGTTCSVMYYTFAFNMTASDCADAADFKSELYTFADPKHLFTLAPMDPETSCICRKYYSESQTEIRCNGCHRWCHTRCVLSDAPHDFAARQEADWVCPECDVS